MGNREPFDFGAMALEAARERDALKARLAYRKEHTPEEQGPVWERDTKMLTAMYREQRRNALLFQHRDKQRRDGYGFQAWPQGFYD